MINYEIGYELEEKINKIVEFYIQKIDIYKDTTKEEMQERIILLLLEYGLEEFNNKVLELLLNDEKYIEV